MTKLYSAAWQERERKKLKKRIKHHAKKMAAWAKF